MKKLKIRKLNIGQLGTLKIDIPVISIGTGPKRAVFLCGMHGDEKSGLFVINELLKEVKELQGTIDIVLATNPLAQALQQRVSPNDSHDLNRVFPGNAKGEFTQRIAKEVVRLCEGASIVIDLHTFQDNAPIVAIFMNSGTSTIRKKIKDLIKIFSPDAVWKLNFASQDEAKLTGALGPILANMEIPNFAVEMPECFLISDDQIKRVKEGLLGVLGNVGISKSDIEIGKTSPPMFHKINIRTDNAGLFLPAKKVLSKVTPGDIVGQLVRLPLFEAEDMKASCSGTLLVIKTRDLVSTGDTIFSIGIKA